MTEKKIKIGIIQEGKIPIDKRTPLTPQNCVELMEKYKNLQIVVQPSKIRIFLDEEYKALKIPIQNDLSDCDYIFGIKEIPKSEIIENKTYLFFSHTIKKQPENKTLLQTLANKKCTLIDYECVKDEKGNRLISFGYFAGIIGAYNTIKSYGHRYRLFELKPAHLCFDYSELRSQFKKIKLKPIKIVLTGGGRVAKGAVEVLSQMRIKEVNKYDFENKDFTYPVFTTAHSEYIYRKKGKQFFDKKEFYKKPELYESFFKQYYSKADVFIACAYWNPLATPLFKKEDMRKSDFKIKIIGDITCDLNGSIPSTIRTTSIDNPVYDYNPFNEELEVPYSSEKNISVISIDNLPCELARTASEDFGKQLINELFPKLMSDNNDSIIEKSKILVDGILSENFEYLREYLER